MTQTIDWKRATVFFDKLKPHGFCFAKNCVAFFNISLLFYP